MATKITRQVLESYFACKSKAYLKLLPAEGVSTDYLNAIREKNASLKAAAEETLANNHADCTIPTRVRITKPLLSAGSPLILDATFEDKHLNLQFDGLTKVEGASALGEFHYAPILFYGGRTVGRLQRQLLGIYAAVLEDIQRRAPGVGIIHNERGAAAKVRLSPDGAAAFRTVLQDLNKVREGVVPTLRLNEHCHICEFRGQCHGQAVKEDNISLLRGISDLEISRLRSKGIFTVNQLSYTFRSRRLAKRAKTPSTPHHFALQALAIRDGKVYVHGAPTLSCSGTLAYLDIEGTPNSRSNYLIGLMVVTENAESYYPFWADDDASEVRLFIMLLDQLDCEGEYSLIHYGSYEIKALRRIRENLPASYRAKIDKAIACSINILSIIRPYIYFPVYSNSLKEIGLF